MAWLAAIVVLAATEGLIGLALLLIGLIGAAAILAGGYWFIAKRDVRRWIGLAVAVLAVVLVIVLFLRAMLIAVALISLACWWSAALRPGTPCSTAPNRGCRSSTVTPPRKPFIVMNPRSGGGKVVKFDLAAKATALGAEVALLDGPGYVDVAALVRAAVAAAPTCWASPAATAPRRWSPASPPSTTCRCW